MPNYRLPTPKAFNPRSFVSQGTPWSLNSRLQVPGVNGPRFPGVPQSYASYMPPRRYTPPPKQTAPPMPANKIEHAASMMGPKSGVTAQQVQAYMRPEVNRGRRLNEVQAAAAAAADNIWAEEARRLGVLTGRAWEDDLIWREHWAFNQGLSNRDPLLSGHPEALKEIEARAIEALKQQRLNLYNALNRERKMTRRSEAGGPAYEPPHKEETEGGPGPVLGEPQLPTPMLLRPEDEVGQGNTVNKGWGGESEY